MKKHYSYFLFLATTFLFTLNSSAMTWNVNVNDNSFSPNALPDVQCGDTIHWTLNSGLPHNTVSTTIPSGATSWAAPITSSSSTFDYIVPNVAGVYNYKCSIHNFFGSFTVTCTAGINDLHSNMSSLIFPNPFTSSVTLTNHNADAVRVTDMTGRVVKTIPLNTSGDKSEINFDALAPGIYFLTTYKEGVILQSQKIVKAK